MDLILIQHSEQAADLSSDARPQSKHSQPWLCNAAREIHLCRGFVAILSAFCFQGMLTIEFGNTAYRGGEDGLHLIFLWPSETSYFASQAAVHKDFVGSKAFMYVTHLCQVLHARGNPLQHANELGGRELSLVLL